MNNDDELDVVFEGRPSHGETDTVGKRVVVIGADAGAYQRTTDERTGRIVYRWQELTEAEAVALINADLWANQQSGAR